MFQKFHWLHSTLVQVQIWRRCDAGGVEVENFTDLLQPSFGRLVLQLELVHVKGSAAGGHCTGQDTEQEIVQIKPDYSMAPLQGVPRH